MIFMSLNVQFPLLKLDIYPLKYAKILKYISIGAHSDPLNNLGIV